MSLNVLILSAWVITLNSFSLLQLWQQSPSVSCLVQPVSSSHAVVSFVLFSLHLLPCPVDEDVWECVNGTTRLVVGAILHRLSFGTRLLPVCRVIVSLSLLLHSYSINGGAVLASLCLASLLSCHDSRVLLIISVSRVPSMGACWTVSTGSRIRSVSVTVAVTMAQSG